MSGTAMKEEVIQKMPYRCPYCDQIIDYDRVGLREGENSIQCPACKKIYIKVVPRLFKGETRR